MMLNGPSEVKGANLQEGLLTMVKGCQILSARPTNIMLFALSSFNVIISQKDLSGQ